MLVFLFGMNPSFGGESRLWKTNKSLVIRFLKALFQFTETGRLTKFTSPPFVKDCHKLHAHHGKETDSKLRKLYEDIFSS